MKGKELKQHLLDRGFKLIYESNGREDGYGEWTFQYHDGQTGALINIKNERVYIHLENFVSKEDMIYQRSCESVCRDEIEIYVHQLDKMIEAMGVDL